MFDSKFIEKLKVGDKVIVNTRLGRIVREVEKITPAGNIKLNNGSIFNKDGSERGGDNCTRSFLSEATPEVIQEIHDAKVIAYTKKRMKELKELNIEQARAILKILSESEEK